MAQHQYDAALGDHYSDVTLASGSSIGGSGVRVTLDDGVLAEKKDAVILLELITQRIKDGDWPPQ